MNETLSLVIEGEVYTEKDIKNLYNEAYSYLVSTKPQDLVSKLMHDSRTVREKSYKIELLKETIRSQLKEMKDMKDRIRELDDNRIFFMNKRRKKKRRKKKRRKEKHENK